MEKNLNWNKIFMLFSEDPQIVLESCSRA